MVQVKVQKGHVVMRVGNLEYVVSMMWWDKMYMSEFYRVGRVKKKYKWTNLFRFRV